MKKPVSLLALASLFLVTVHASTITVDTVSYAYSGQIGVYHNGAAGLDVIDIGMYVGQSNLGQVGTGDCTGAVLMTQPYSIANTNITSGHYVHMVNVTLQDTSLVSMCFKVTVLFNGSTLGPLYLKTSGTPATGDSVSCTFDLGISPTLGSYTLEVFVEPAG